IEKKDNIQLYGTPWYEKWTMGRMIQLNTSSPYKNARNRIRKWKKQK
ncbi:MAG: ClbS/DfsB family four-helix bundle protein, partial [Firmicutes bacterium]|nr:ClbS/DfsB family four-helix bundle protein [Bacillota bacterium]